MEQHTWWIAPALVVGAVACDDPPPAPPPPVATAGVAHSAAPSATVAERVETVDDTPDGADALDDPEAPSADSACAPEDPSLVPMQLLRFTWTSGIEGRDAKDRLHVARPGQRVYAHLHMRNRSARERCLRLVFRVGDKKRTEVTLKIGRSWNWRTWAFNTLKGDDRAPLSLSIVDDQGRTVVEQKLPVVPE